MDGPKYLCIGCKAVYGVDEAKDRIVGGKEWEGYTHFCPQCGTVNINIHAKRRYGQEARNEAHE